MIRGDRCDGVPCFRQPDGRAEDCSQIKTTMAVHQVAPGGTGPWDSDGVRMIGRKHRAKPFLLQPGKGQRQRGPTGAVQRGYHLGGSLIVQNKAVTANPGGRRLGDIECRGSGDGRVGGRAAFI